MFDVNGKYQTQWNNMHRPCGLCAAQGRQPLFYIGELGPTMPVNREIPNLGPRISIVNHEGKLVGRVGDIRAGQELNQFIAPHGLAIDSRGDLYVGEVSYTAWSQVYPGTEPPRGLRSLRKLVRVG